VAKGYAADRLAVLAADFDCTGGLIEVGGEIRVFGERTDGGPWKIGVEAPAVRPGAPRVIGSILKIDPNGRFQALATSGDSRNRRTVDGFSFSHILDPRTGRPVVNPPASVTVVAPSCAVADAWATALLVLGPEQGLPLAVQAGLEVCFQIRIADGSFRTIASDGYTALLAATPDD
jgi:FAD:protein FMN transferase